MKYLLFLLFVGCTAPVEMNDVPTADHPNAVAMDVPDSGVVTERDVPDFDARGDQGVVANDMPTVDRPTVIDVPNRDVPNGIDVPNPRDVPTVNDVPDPCPGGALRCGTQCCLGTIGCSPGGNCGACMPGANSLCQRPDGVFVCVNDQSNNSHCGRCNNPCLLQEPFCVAGRCTPR